jgi:hypothetical protein
MDSLTIYIHAAFIATELVFKYLIFTLPLMVLGVNFA